MLLRMTAILRPARAQAAAAAAWASLVVVLALWLRNRGLQDLMTGSTAWTSAGRLTGLVASDLLLLQVLLLARVPAIERSFGQDRLARWHRVLGFSSFNLMLVHIVLVTLGYASTDGRNPAVELWRLVVDYPGMLLALAAAVALTMVTVTSIRMARRRLRYESWHLLHLYAYLGVGLALPHQLWTGSDFINSPWARAYWWTLYGVVAASVLAFRVALPLLRSARHRLVVHDIVDEAPGVVSVHLSGRRLDRLPVRAGQFFVLRFLSGKGWTRGHPYSLSAAPDPRLLRITVKELGDDSSQLSLLRRGTRVLIEGPYGRLSNDRRTQKRVLLMAAGIGITPLRALIEEMDSSAEAVTLLYRARDESDVVFGRELDLLARSRGFSVVRLLGRRRADDSWLPVGVSARTDAQILRDLVPDVGIRDVFICGPDAWIDAACAAAQSAGVPAGRIHSERFAW